MPNHKNWRSLPTFCVAGVSYQAPIPAWVDRNTYVYLQGESKNVHDAFALQVWARRVLRTGRKRSTESFLLGYVPRGKHQRDIWKARWTRHEFRAHVAAREDESSYGVYGPKLVIKIEVCATS